jgi:hypothetical protein
MPVSVITVVQEDPSHFLQGEVLRCSLRCHARSAEPESLCWHCARPSKNYMPLPVALCGAIYSHVSCDQGFGVTPTCRASILGSPFPLSGCTACPRALSGSISRLESDLTHLASTASGNSRMRHTKNAASRTVFISLNTDELHRFSHWRFVVPAGVHRWAATHGRQVPR